jgi:hypothetical protein
MTFRPLDDRLNQALDRYRQENYLPSRNAAINQILSRALLASNTTDTAPATPPPPPTPPAPIAPIGWN